MSLVFFNTIMSYGVACKTYPLVDHGVHCLLRLLIKYVRYI